MERGWGGLEAWAYYIGHGSSSTQIVMAYWLSKKIDATTLFASLQPHLTVTFGDVLVAFATLKP
jgi:hypothetical protein